MTDESASVTAARQLLQDARAEGRWRPPVLRRRRYRLRPLLKDGSLVARDGSGEVIARAELTEVRTGQWNVVTFNLSPPAVPECGR